MNKENLYDLLDLDTCFALNEEECPKSPGTLGKGNTLCSELKALGGNNVQEQDYSHRGMSPEDSPHDGSLPT